MKRTSKGDAPKRRALARTHITRDLPPGPLILDRADSHAPIVSVVMATYNRSNVLALAIASVVAQHLGDWELLVIGDACTDDTATVVAGFRDPRIHFVNLEENLGEQSGPNSIGRRLARGRFIAWLNHDDLWFPNHLSDAIRALDGTAADIWLSPWFTVGPRVGPTDDESSPNPLPPAGLDRSSPTGVFRVSDVYPASTWVMRASTAERLGDWRSAFELRGVSSQDYLYRGWADGSRFVIAETPSVVAVPSGLFTNAYSEQRDGEHRALAPHVIGGSVEAFLQAIEPSWGSPRDRLSKARSESRFLRTTTRYLYRQAIIRPASGVLARLGCSPTTTAAFFTGQRTGQLIRDLREKRGLPSATSGHDG